MKHLFCIFLLFFIDSLLYSQDTISIYFDYGKSRIEWSEEQKIRHLPANYDLSSVEKVWFVGFADSTGFLQSNLRLSNKRAKKVYISCKSFFNASVETEVIAKGEGSLNDLSENRRVDIILFYPEVPPEVVEETIEDVDPKCFFVDFQALEYCSMKIITKRRREYVYIEAMDMPLFRDRDHYFAVQGYDGKASIRKLRWRKKTTGRWWWRKNRLVATIPKKSFDQFQFFTLDDPPCSGCKEEILSEDTIIMNVPKFYPDHFLMSNMQVRMRLFKLNEVKIRVPKEFVDIEDDYYFSYNTKAVRWLHNSQNTIIWSTKKFGKKRKNYYFANVPVHDNRLPYLFRKRMTTICVGERYNTGFGTDLRCGYLGSGLGAFRFRVSLEPGVFYHNDTVTGYLVAGLSHNSFINLNLQAGVNSNMGLYSTFNFRYFIWTFRLSALNPIKRWMSPTKLKNVPNSLMTIYGGGEGRTSFKKQYQSFFEGNLHIGLQMTPRFFGLFPTLYLHGGAGYDFLSRVNDKVYPHAQFGVRFHLF